ncbi:DUF2827 family protein [bacterium]|nr:DUF2827 family protein [Candidatus Elulimicrobium humile]
MLMCIIKWIIMGPNNYEKMRKHMKKINVAITVNIEEPSESLFVNGIKQNAIILRDCLLRSELVNEVYYMNFGPQRDLSHSLWKKYERWIIHDFNEALEKIDLYLNVCISMNEVEMKLAHDRGAKVVKFMMGNEYYIFSEKVLFKGDVPSIHCKTEGIDANWMSPHLYETNHDFYEVLFDAPSYVAPYIWSPQFMMEHVEELKKMGYVGTYVPSGKAKRVCVFEPNIQMNKTSIYPMIIAEKFYGKYPDKADSFTMFGTSEIKRSKPFIKFGSGLHVNRAKKLFFEGRYPIAWSLLKHTDIVLSHQQDLALNYLYFDAAWLGFPVVHNAEFVKELGWYYGKFEADEAVRHLNEIMTVFDTVPGYREEYMKNSREYISQFLPEHDRNVSGYTQLIRNLFKE